MARSCHDLTVTFLRPNRLSIRYIDEETLEISFHRPTKASVKTAAAQFEGAFAEVEASLTGNKVRRRPPPPPYPVEQERY